MKKLFLILFLPSLFYAQYKYSDRNFPRDTSFTTASAAVKVLKKYPQVKVVQAEVPENVVADYNIIYSSYGKRNLRMDIFRPKVTTEKSFPAVLIIFGGGWRSGHKEMEWPTAIKLASAGFVTAAVEYRLSPEALYPAGIYDLKAAIRWLRANADLYNIDSGKIAVEGCSAGGELATFLGTTGEIKKFEGEGGNPGQSTKVQAVIDVDGIVDFTNPYESDKDKNPEKPSAGKYWFGFSYDENPAPWVEASPMSYLNENDPPVLFINSSLPNYHAGRDYMIEKMKMYGIYSEVHTIQNTPHPFWLFHPWFDEAVDYMIKFLNKIFYNK